MPYLFLRRCTSSLTLLSFLGLGLQLAHAGSATWNTTPANGLWSNANNWTPATVPSATSDTATFGVSSTTNIEQALLSVGSIVFAPGASPYIITPLAPAQYTMAGTGIINNSGILQKFTISADQGSQDAFTLASNATAGAMTEYTVQGGPDAATLGALMTFDDAATADTASFIINGGTGSGGHGGTVQFVGQSTAATATITNNAGSVAGAQGAATVFAESAGAATSTLVANGGVGFGSTISFADSSHGDSASVKLFGNGSLDISAHDSSGMTLGSLEGDGQVHLGARRLTIGRNRVSTTFSGLIQDGGNSGGTGGAFAKVGAGTLTLTNANTYTGDTSVNGGTFTVNNSTGSATGTGPVQVNAGILGGSGTIAGAVTVGAPTEDRPHLAPASGGQTPTTLTIQGSLTFTNTGGYNWVLRAKGRRAQADRVNANGVVIVSGATFTVLPQVHGAMQIGTILTVISNTGATPISGTFSNLADGAIINVSGNNLQADYQGGDGNDLTLSVVQ